MRLKICSAHCHAHGAVLTTRHFQRSIRYGYNERLLELATGQEPEPAFYGRRQQPFGTSLGLALEAARRADACNPL